MQMEVTDVCFQALIVSMLDNDFNGKIFVTFVYASCDGIERRRLWDHLVYLVQLKFQGPWCVVGDFNTMLSVSEKKGGRFLRPLYMEDFKDCLSTCKLFDAGFVGSSFTWRNKQGDNRILAKLDKCLLSDHYQYVRVKVSHLSRANSDYAPLLVSISKQDDSGTHPFKFLNVWLEDEACIRVIKQSWEQPVMDVGDMSFR